MLKNFKGQEKDYSDDLPLFADVLKSDELNEKEPEKKDVKTTKVMKNIIPKKQQKTAKPAFIDNTGNLGLTLGSYLQEARVKSEYSLSQVSMITKLNIHYIEAIERDDLKNAPPYIYVKAYVKKLCDLYKVDEQKALNLLDTGNQNKSSKEKVLPDTLLQDLEQTKQIDKVQEKKVRYITRILTISSAVLVVIVLIAFFSFGGESEVKENVPKDSTALKSLINKKMEGLIASQTLSPSELKIPDSKSK